MHGAARGGGGGFARGRGGGGSAGRGRGGGAAPAARAGTSHALATAVTTATAGPVGAAFAVQHRDWKCLECGQENSGRYRTCKRCKVGARGEETVKWNEGALAAAQGEDHGWREAMDPASKQLYYVNERTGESAWERPAVMGPAPLGTGWFGRGAAGGQRKYDEQDEVFRARPAVRQAEPPPADAAASVAVAEGGGEWNMWFGRYTGEQWSQKKARGEKADARCDVAKHAGATKADEEAYFCLWFAKGVCHRGRLCRFHHRVPTVKDGVRLEKDSAHDVFGRQRLARPRDDMTGVSCLHDPSRTLFIGGLVRGPYEQDQDALRECVQRHFAEWGEVENVNVVWHLSIAFVRYRLRANAEFAMEAMDHQSLDHEEVIAVRWAREDPNPIAKEANARANADAVVAAVKAVAASSSSSSSSSSAPASAAPALPSAALPALPAPSGGGRPHEAGPGAGAASAEGKRLRLAGAGSG